MFQSKLITISSQPENKKLFTLLSPVTGKSYPLDDFGSALFSQGLFGEGVAVQLTGSKLLSPFNGTVSQLSPQGNHIRLTADNGVQILVHIGLTLDAPPLIEGFNLYCQPQQSIKTGDMLLSFNLQKLRTVLGNVTCAITVLNSHKMTGILPFYRSLVAIEDPLMKLYI